ncbi:MULTISPECIES: anthranilate synthase component II [Dysgonomonas]|uniref:anthranilate synthase component II n=1 Tax=Dysgonomonas TaxID=156973 RepID=UPI0009290269|nr:MULTISPECIES: aminodeoxychorismate/anthranilate synthase component II [Dysgonomonas]MBN9301233.1 aminodeoxychorismate/anthranilate synthase component II [Dysgonomonas mossii]OJX60060.1 MAG: aminodeoxychorismate/anthranilate synthase component II [Dysgonomonas sp. 37-18]
MKILIFDNYDSFTYNLVHLVKELGYTDVDVFRNDKIALEDVAKYDKIILSPGPGIPSEAGLLLPLIKEYAGKRPILGVCLGHQAIGEAFGAQLKNLEDVYHGVATRINITQPDYIFDTLGSELEVGRYHSWIVDNNGLPDCIEITATDNNGQIMALKHKEFDVHGVQFHPESVLTPAGETIVKNFLNQ